MRKLFISSLFIGIFFLSSCESMKNKFTKSIKNITGSCFKVTLFSGGNPVKSYLSTYVTSEEGSDGWFFRTIDGKFIVMSGNVVIEEINEKYCER